MVQCFVALSACSLSLHLAVRAAFGLLFPVLVCCHLGKSPGTDFAKLAFQQVVTQSDCPARPHRPQPRPSAGQMLPATVRMPPARTGHTHMPVSHNSRQRQASKDCGSGKLPTDDVSVGHRPSLLAVQTCLWCDVPASGLVQQVAGPAQCPGTELPHQA
jgi:hypothetical protein